MWLTSVVCCNEDRNVVSYRHGVLLSAIDYCLYGQSGHITYVIVIVIDIYIAPLSKTTTQKCFRPDKKTTIKKIAHAIRIEKGKEEAIVDTTKLLTESSDWSHARIAAGSRLKV